MRIIRHLLLAFLTSSGLFAPLNIAAAADPPGRNGKVLLIGLDGVRPDALLAAETPSFDRLIEHGALSTTAQAADITVSGPCWSGILTGVWRDKHGVADNEFTGRDYETYPCFFKRIKEARPDLVTASFITWLPLDTFIIESSGADIRIVHDYEDDGDEKCVQAAVETLLRDDPDVTFFYFADPDIAGHNHGFHPASPAYLEEIESVDAQVGRLLDAVHGRDTYDREDWLILVITDHGGTLAGGHGGGRPVQRTIFYLASGAGAARGELRDTVNQVDAAVTAMAHLGIELDPAWKMDGRVIGLKKSTPFGVNLIYNGDAERSTGAADLAVNRGIAGWRDLGAMTVIAYGAAEGFPSPDSPGPPDRGRNFFSGGAGDSEMSQVIDLRDIAEVIDAGDVRFELSACLGGFADQRDLATLTVRFVDERGGELGRAALGPVTVEDRTREIGGEGEALTGLLPRRTEGALPPATRSIEVILTAETGSGACDGYADNISLVLSRQG